MGQDILENIGCFSKRCFEYYYGQFGSSPVFISRSCKLVSDHVAGPMTTQVYEFWPSDLEALFRIASVPRRTPPPSDPNCDANAGGHGFAPGITSPARDIAYSIEQRSADLQVNAITEVKTGTKIPATGAIEAARSTEIPFTAVTDAESRVVLLVRRFGVRRHLPNGRIVFLESASGNLYRPRGRRAGPCGGRNTHRHPSGQMSMAIRSRLTTS
jgi:hypothetical protein